MVRLQTLNLPIGVSASSADQPMRLANLSSSMYWQESMYYVYVIESEQTTQLYKGMTTDVQNRLAEHNAGKVKSTQPYLPYHLIYCEGYLNKSDAMRQEKYLKSGSGRELIKRKLSDYFATR